MSEAERIAEGLSGPMQRAILSDDPANIRPINGGVSYSLKRDGLTQYVSIPSSSRNHIALTPLGLAVRDYLIKKEGGRG